MTCGGRNRVLPWLGGAFNGFSDSAGDPAQSSPSAVPMLIQREMLRAL